MVRTNSANMIYIEVVVWSHCEEILIIHIVLQL